jgi:predicted transcriptional regulator YdeE
MKFEQVDEFQVAGVAARTNNAREMTPEGAIPPLWIGAIDVREKAPHALDAAIIAVYTEYESDEHGAYTFVLGAKADPSWEIPDGLVLKTVPAGRYAVFTSERGPVQKVVVETWQRIWRELPSTKNLRSYIADFEVYDQRASDPANAVVEIYVGVE